MTIPREVCAECQPNRRTENDQENPTEDSSEVLVPLNKLKKSPKNVRKMPHTEAEIEALAASIAANGLLQNLVVEAETDGGKPTGCYLVKRRRGAQAGAAAAGQAEGLQERMSPSVAPLAMLNAPRK